MNAAAVRPYMMDLGSTNGTFLNNERLEPTRYYELLEQVLARAHRQLQWLLLQDWLRHGGCLHSVHAGPWCAWRIVQQDGG